MYTPLLTIALAIPNLVACQVQGVSSTKRVSVVVQAFVGRTQSDDCLIFKTDKGEFYIYDSNDQGLEYVKLLKGSLESKRPVCLVLDPSVKGYVQGVLPKCSAPSA